jgi:hypothetical protein
MGRYCPLFKAAMADKTSGEARSAPPCIGPSGVMPELVLLQLLVGSAATSPWRGWTPLALSAAAPPWPNPSSSPSTPSTAFFLFPALGSAVFGCRSIVVGWVVDLVEVFVSPTDALQQAPGPTPLGPPLPIHPTTSRSLQVVFYITFFPVEFSLWSPSAKPLKSNIYTPTPISNMPDQGSVWGWQIAQWDLGQFHGKCGGMKQGISHFECSSLLSSQEVVTPTLALTWSLGSFPSSVISSVPTTACRFSCNCFHFLRQRVVTCNMVDVTSHP